MKRSGWTWRRILLSGLLALAGGSQAASASVVELKDAMDQNLAPHVETLEDPSGHLSPFQILQPEMADQWQSNNQSSVNRRYNSTVIWLRFTLDAALSVHKEWALVLANPLLDHIDLYQIFEGSGPRLIYRSGMSRPFDNRVEDHRFFVFPIEVYGPTTFLMRVETSPASYIPLQVYPSDNFWAPLLQGDIANWLFFGVILAMVMYNFFLYLTIGDTSYLYYVLFVSSFGLMQLSLDGYIYQYFWWPDAGFDYRLNFWLAASSVVFAALFIIRFLNLDQVSVRLTRCMALVIGIQLVYVGLSFFIDMALFARLFTPNLVLFMLLAVLIGFFAWRKGMVAAKFFVLAWTLFGVGNILFLLIRNGWVDLPFPPMLASKLGSFMETMLLGFALAHRIRSLRDERERARMRAEAQSYFLAQVSHEIRTPLNGVLGMTEVLSRTRLDNEQRSYVDTIQGSGTSLLTLINDILDYSKIEAGKMELHRERADLHRLASQQVQLFRSQAEHKQLELSLTVAPEVPERLVIDVQRLRQILSNLISNAIKYTEQGSVAVSLSMELEGGQSLLVCRVTDTGIGIPEDQLGELFSVYHQVEPNRRRTAGGTGLGLAICQQLVSLMGGDIQVRSQPGEGSEFTIRVPFEPETSRKTGARMVSESLLQPLRILVAEDNIVNQKVIEGLLVKLGHQVGIAPNGAEAISHRMRPDFDYDLILMDCEMPGVDGYEATRNIREYERGLGKSKVPIVALTAHALEEIRTRCLDAGMDDFLTKPINTRRLLRVLEKLRA